MGPILRSDNSNRLMTLVLHDTLTREKRPFVPHDPDRVTLYVCGPTVYNYAHIGNARPAVVFDVLFRLLRRLYGAGARDLRRATSPTWTTRSTPRRSAEGVPISEITGALPRRSTTQDMARLGALPPTLEPARHPDDGRDPRQIAALVEQRRAPTRPRATCCSTRRAFPDYGKLSGRSLDDMIAGARVEVAPYKRNPPTSCCGSRPSPASRSGTAPGGRAGPAGTSSARR